MAEDFVLYSHTSSDRKEMGEMIRVARKFQEISQRQLMINSGLSLRKIVAIEKGYLNYTNDEFIKYAEGLNVSIVYK